MYIGEKSLSNLRIYIDGFTCGLDTYLEMNFPETFLGMFQNWIANKFEVKTNQHWSMIIEFNSTSHSEAFDKFYKLLDEFITQNQL